MAGECARTKVALLSLAGEEIVAISDFGYVLLNIFNNFCFPLFYLTWPSAVVDGLCGHA